MIIFDFVHDYLLKYNLDIQFIHFIKINVYTPMILIDLSPEGVYWKTPPPPPHTHTHVLSQVLTFQQIYLGGVSVRELTITSIIETYPTGVRSGATADHPPSCTWPPPTLTTPAPCLDHWSLQRLRYIQRTLNNLWVKVWGGSGGMGVGGGALGWSKLPHTKPRVSPSQ